MKKAIVIGASSGIGRSLAKVLAGQGYAVGLVARRVQLLKELQAEIPGQTFVKRIDISQADQAMRLLRELIQEMGGLDLIIINSAINNYNVDLKWQGELEMINVDVTGFAAMANVAVGHFLTQKSGHLVGISSIAALRGRATCVSYSASKAFVSTYLEGLRYLLRKNNIYVTDIRPGLVETAMIKGLPMLFWVAQPEGAAEQIWGAIKKRRKIAYITRRWRIIAWISKLLPDPLWYWANSIRMPKRESE